MAITFSTTRWCRWRIPCSLKEVKLFTTRGWWSRWRLEFWHPCKLTHLLLLVVEEGDKPTNRPTNEWAVNHNLRAIYCQRYEEPLILYSSWNATVLFTATGVASTVVYLWANSPTSKTNTDCDSYASSTTMKPTKRKVVNMSYGDKHMLWCIASAFQ